MTKDGFLMLPALTAAEREDFIIKNYMPDLLDWLRIEPGEPNRFSPLVQRKDREFTTPLDPILPDLQSMSESLGIELVCSSDAFDHGGGRHSARSKGTRISIAPLSLWRSSPEPVMGLPAIGAIYHLNATLAHEIGHAAANRGKPLIWPLRRKIYYFATLLPGMIAALFLLLGLLSLLNSVMGVTSTLIPPWRTFFWPVIAPFCVSIVGAVVWILINPRLQAKEEVVAELVGYCIMRSFFESSKGFSSNESWRVFEYSRTYLLAKIKSIRRNRQVKFFNDLTAEVDARIAHLNASFHHKVES